MTSRIGPGCWSATCRALVVLAAFLTFAQRGVATEEPLYPHAERESGPWGYIDKSGRIIIPLQFEAAEPFSEGLAAVRVHNRESTLVQRYGFIDRTGRLVIDAGFQQVRRFQAGRVGVMFPPSGPNPFARWGVIDRDGKLILPPLYADVHPYKEGIAVVVAADRFNKRKSGAIDLDGAVVIEPELDWLSDFSEGLAPASRDGKYGYVDKTGAVAIPFQFQRAFPFHNGLARVLIEKSGPFGFIDKTGTIVMSVDFNMVHEFENGYAVALKQGKGGLVDDKGNTLIAPRFNVGRSSEHPVPFEGSPGLASMSDGLLPVSASWNDGYGYVNKDGAFVIEPRFKSAFGFHDGRAVVKVEADHDLSFAVKGSKAQFAGLINKTGGFVAPPVFDWIKPRPGGPSQVRLGDRLGYIDAQGRPLTYSGAEFDAYVAERRKKLEEQVAAPPPRKIAPPLPPPAPGRGLIAKAGETEYYLHLPEGLCPLDDSHAADRRFIEERWAEADKAFEAMKALKPMSSDVERIKRKDAEDRKLKARYVFVCDELAKLRAGSIKTVGSYVVTTGTQKDRYDPSMGAGAVWANALMCGMMRGGDVFKWSDGKDNDSTGTVTDAFKRLAAGKPIALGAKIASSAK